MPIRVSLRDLRERAGLSQAALSDKAGVRQAAISHIETGKAQRIDIDVLERLCRALHCKPADLLRLVSKRSGRR
jgi:putative transcriptional regulator